MKILHIETSSKNCSVAISDNDQLLCLCEEVSENYKQSESLHTFVEWALEGADIKLADINIISLGKGPGSYTGLRIGAAAAKGFCFGLDIPLVSINSLDTMAEPFINQGYDKIISLVDARRMEVYTATYDGTTGKLLSPTEAMIIDEFSFQKFKEEKILFVGDGCQKAEEVFQLSNAKYMANVFPSAQFLIRKAMEKCMEQSFEDVTYFEPFYLKDFHGVKKSERTNNPT